MILCLFFFLVSQLEKGEATQNFTNKTEIPNSVNVPNHANANRIENENSNFKHKSSKNNHQEIKCKENQTLSDSGECVCLPGFFGIPSETGCFQCLHTCHPNATCVSPNHCECKIGFIQVENNECISNIPSIIYYSPQKCSFIGKRNITFTVNKIPRTFSHLYCMFDNSIQQSNSLSEENFIKNTFSCLIPPHIPETISVSVSYDSIHWSKFVSLSYFYDDQIEYSIFYSNSFLNIVSIILFIIFIIMNYFLGTFSQNSQSIFEPANGNDPQEYQPFSSSQFYNSSIISDSDDPSPEILTKNRFS